MLNGKTPMTTLFHQDDIANSAMTMKTTNTGKNKKINRKVRKEIVEDI